MKKRINIHSVIAAFFVCFIFVILVGTVTNIYISRDVYIKVYSGYLNETSGVVEKTKAVVLTAYSTLKNIDTRVYRRNEFINVYGLTQKLTGNRYVYDPEVSKNDVVKLDNGVLSFVIQKTDDLKTKAEKILTLNNHLHSKGIDLLYVQLPFKINKLDKELPTGVYDFSNENADTMVSELKNKNISAFDLREEIVKDGLDHYSLFFRTDHHWKPETGLWAAGKISEKLNTDFCFNIDLKLLEIKNFSSKLYKDYFLGSQGKRVGKYYAGTDDFTLLLPTYKTGMNCAYNRISGEWLLKKGSFKDSWIFSENLEKIDYFDINAYASYSGGDYSLTISKNNLISGKKILILRDSYTDALAPFLSLAACNELRTIDPRYFTGSITDYIDEFNPDIVLMLYYPTCLTISEFFEF